MKGDKDEVWPQGRNLKARFEGDTVGEEVRTPTRTPLGIDTRKPGNFPLIKMRQQADPAQGDFADLFNPNKPEDDWEVGFGRPSRDPRRYNQQRKPTFSELFSHPQAEAYVPELGGIPMDANYSFGGDYDYGGNYGNFKKGDDARAFGQQGGIGTMNSMEQVAAHEVIGHGQQDKQYRPWGGNYKESDQTAHGQSVMDLAKQRTGQLGQWQADELNRLQSEGHADPFEEFERLYPNFYDWREKYRDWTSGRIFGNERFSPLMRNELAKPNYVGYMAEGGEASARNIEERARKLSSRIPMTGEEQWQQFPGNDPAATTAAIEQDQRPLQADVHPFATMDIPPDLQRQRYLTGPQGSNDRKLAGGLRAHPDKFDWIFGPGGKLGLAGAAATPLLTDGGEASAAEAAPKGDRLGTPSKDEVMQQRLALARQMSGSADRRATGATSPERPPEAPLTFGGALASGLSGARNSVEDWLGSGGGMRGMGNLTPQPEQVRDITDRYTPKPVQDWTRYESKSPVERAWKWLAEQVTF